MPVNDAACPNADELPLEACDRCHAPLTAETAADVTVFRPDGPAYLCTACHAAQRLPRPTYPPLTAEESRGPNADMPPTQ